MSNYSWFWKGPNKCSAKVFVWRNLPETWGKHPIQEVKKPLHAKYETPQLRAKKSTGKPIETARSQKTLYRELYGYVSYVSPYMPVKFYLLPLKTLKITHFCLSSRFFFFFFSFLLFFLPTSILLAHCSYLSDFCMSLLFKRSFSEVKDLLWRTKLWSDRRRSSLHGEKLDHRQTACQLIYKM